MSKTFLQAEWRKLALANYAIDPKILLPHLPAMTELDLWEDKCYVSLVGFLFQNVKVKGIKIPFHINFEEVNLRFYVRFKENGQWKRGVVFIKEIVPKPAITFVANTFYKEHYATMPMRHSWLIADDKLTIEYKWKYQRWNTFKVVTDNNASLIRDNSEEAFITEHYWGYTKLSKDKTSEYGVEHPKWEVYNTKHYFIDVDFGALYGNEFEFLMGEKPSSVFLAEGSAITVKEGRILYAD